MAVLVFKIRFAVFTSELRYPIACQKVVDWKSQSPNAFKGVLLPFHSNENETFEKPIISIREDTLRKKHDGQTKNLLRVLRLVIQYNTWSTQRIGVI
ncbi:unnamed protein product [Alternaria alternata]